MNNNILEGMRITYDRKYDIAYENLLRYLKSSVDILDDKISAFFLNKSLITVTNLKIEIEVIDAKLQSLKENLKK